MTLVLVVGALVHVATLPFKLSLSMLHVFKIISGILVTIKLFFALFPFAFALFAALIEITLVDGARFPLIVTIWPMWQTKLIGADVYILDSEHVATLTMFQALDPFTLIFISVLPYVDALAIYFICFPFACV